MRNEMSSKGGRVTLDADEFLNILDELANLEKRLRNLGREGYKIDNITTRPSSPASQEKKDESEAMQLSIDISGIDWRRSNKAGGGAADLGDGWAWAFAFTKDGGIRREAAQLVAALEQYGKVLVDGFEITLAGRDGNLLNRKKGSK